MDSVTPEYLQYLMMKDIVAKKPEADQSRIHLIVAQLKAVVEANGDHGLMAFALYGAELAAETE